jgi:PST family polysaccharide transporter
MPLGFWIGSHWGVTGIAAAWALVHPIFGLRLLYFGIKRVETTVGQYLQALRPALTGAAVMTVAVVGTGLLMPDSWHGIARLVLKILAGAIAYCATVLILHQDRLLTFRQLWSAMRKS